MASVCLVSDKIQNVHFVYFDDDYLIPLYFQNKSHSIYDLSRKHTLKVTPSFEWDHSEIPENILILFKSISSITKIASKNILFPGDHNHFKLFLGLHTVNLTDLYMVKLHQLDDFLNYISNNDITEFLEKIHPYYFMNL